MLGPSLILSTEISAPSESSRFQTRSGKTAIRWIRNRSLGFSKLLIDPASWDEDFLTLLLEARRHRPVTPIWLIGSRDGLNASDFARLGIQGRLPSIPDELKGQPQSQPLSQSATLIEDGEYLGIPVVDFLDLDQAHLDIFIKSPQGKWLLLAQAGEPGIGSRVQNYWSRGLRHLFVQRDAYARQLTSIELFRNLLSTTSQGPSILKPALAIRDTSKIIESLRSMEEVTQGAWEQVADSLTLIHRQWAVGPWANPQTALQSASLLDHSVSVLVLSLLIGRSLGFESEENTVRLGLAAAFHDIGLLGLEFTVPGGESLSALASPAERQRFAEHPTVAAEWIRDHIGADTIISQAVALHHWRRDDSGFYQKSAQPVLEAPRMAEIIGLAETAAFDLLKFPVTGGRSRVWRDRLASRVEDQFSTAVVEGFSKSL